MFQGGVLVSASLCPPDIICNSSLVSTLRNQNGVGFTRNNFHSLQIIIKKKTLK